jgi:hypothetical protein
VLSQDGLPLAAYPEAEEVAIAALWSRLASVGPVTRGFLTVRSEVWAFVQGERHGAMVVADRAVRPGQMLDVLDGVLAQAAAAEVLAGSDRLGVGRGDPRAPAARRFSTPLHREGRPADHEDEPLPVTADVVVSLDEAAAVAGAAQGVPGGQGVAAPAAAAPPPVAPAHAAAPEIPAPPAPVTDGAAVHAVESAPDPEAQATVDAAVEVPQRDRSVDQIAATPVEPVAAEPMAPATPIVAEAAAKQFVAERPANPAATPVAAPVEAQIEAPVAAPPDEPTAGAAQPERAPAVSAEDSAPAPQASPPEESQAPAPAEGRAGGEVDIIALAREFAGLIIERE